MDEKDLKIMETMMTRVVGVFFEDVQQKFPLLSRVSGYWVRRRIDRKEEWPAWKCGRRESSSKFVEV